VELRHLRYFVAVAEELHFRRAAERLHLAQPAVSEQVRKLEQELGVRLLDRDRRRVELTDAGSALLVEARQHLVVLPWAANPAFYDAIVSACRQAGLSPTLVELAEPQIEHALLAVTAGAGMALLPESVVDRYAAPGIRLLPLSAPHLLLETAVVARAGAVHGPTAAFLDALARIGALGAVGGPARVVPLAA
jgi:DNA-binding transcriptional LysR family regulator